MQQKKLFSFPYKEFFILLISNHQKPDEIMLPLWYASTLKSIASTYKSEDFYMIQEFLCVKMFQDESSKFNFPSF